MTPESVAWERAAEVRDAAEGWRGAGAIDDATAARIRAAYPDPCVTPSPVWRVLTAAVVSAVLLCLLGGVALATVRADRGLQILLLIFAAGAIAATEVLQASPAWNRRGAAGATAFWGVVFLLTGLGIMLANRARLDDALDGTLAFGVVAWGLACWRWGSPVFAGLSAVALFGLLARVPEGRLAWIAAAAVLIGFAARRLDHAPWAPSHRRAAAVLLLAGIGAGYAAVNTYSLDERLIEQLSRRGASGTGLPPAVLVASAIATMIVPLVVLWWGLRSRRTLLIDAGILLAALSAATLRYYVSVAPLWTVLVLAGAALVGVALALERALRRAPGGEIAGFTADALFSDERRALALQVVPAVATFSPAGQAPAAEDEGLGAGGKFGGAGATEKF